MPAANVGDVAWAFQASKGTAAATSAHRVWTAGGDQPHPERTKEDFEETTGGQMLAESYVSATSVSGTPEMFLMPEMAGALLYAALGAKTPSGSSDPWTHVFTMASVLPWMTWWQMVAAARFTKHIDCKVGGLRISGESGKPLKIAPRVMGLASRFKTAHEATATIERADRFMHYDGSGALLLEGAAASSISSFTIDIDRGLTSVPGDSLAPHSLEEGRASIVVTTDQLVSDFGLWNRMHFGTASPSDDAVPTKDVLTLGGSPAGLQFTWTHQASPERSLKVAIPLLQVDPFDIQPSTSSDPLRQQVTYRAYMPISGSPITATLKNGKASYA